MVIVLSEKMQLAIDVAIHLRKTAGTQSEAIIDRKLIDLLLAIDYAESMQEVCKELSYSPRYVQRTLKRFTEASGLRLVNHHGRRGCCLSEEGRQCINLYVAARDCMEQLVKTHSFPRALPPLQEYPSPEDWNHRSL